MRAGAITLLATLVLGALMATPMSDAQPAAKAPMIGVLIVNPRSTPQFMAFEQRLRELGWIDGQTIVIDFRRVERSALPQTLLQRADRIVQ